jgi:hypothetical protein
LQDNRRKYKEVTAMHDAKPIITIKEARKLLGKDAQTMSDEAVEQLISDLDFIARYAIKQFKELNQNS